MHFSYKLLLIIGLVFSICDAYGAEEKKEEVDLVDNLIQHIRPLPPFITESNIPNIIKDDLIQKIADTYQGDEDKAKDDIKTEKWYTQACDGNATAYQELKTKAKRNDPIAQGYFARFLHSMGNAYFFVEDLNSKLPELLYQFMCC